MGNLKGMLQELMTTFHMTVGHVKTLLGLGFHGVRVNGKGIVQI